MEESERHRRTLTGARLLVPPSCVAACTARIRAAEAEHPIPPEFGGY
jgi:hypothetical protein